MRRFAFSVMCCLLSGTPSSAQAPSITIAATTSFADSGLAGVLLPKFKAATGIEVKLISRGSGEDLGLLDRGLVDLVLVNELIAVDRIAATGREEEPRRVMANHFVIAGPSSDPAQVKHSDNLAQALRIIALHRAPFISRGDGSGTHEMERRLWEQARVRPQSRSGNWYREAGLGMLETLQIAARIGAYTLTDRATWLAMNPLDRARLPIIIGNGAEATNQYYIMTADHRRHPTVAAEAAKIFADWLTSDDGQSAISAYRIDGQQVFTANAQPGT